MARGAFRPPARPPAFVLTRPGAPKCACRFAPTESPRVRSPHTLRSDLSPTYDRYRAKQEWLVAQLLSCPTFQSPYGLRRRKPDLAELDGFDKYGLRRYKPNN